MHSNIEELRKKYMNNPAEGMTSASILITVHTRHLHPFCTYF